MTQFIEIISNVIQLLFMLIDITLVQFKFIESMLYLYLIIMLYKKLSLISHIIYSISPILKQFFFFLEVSSYKRNFLTHLPLPFFQ